MTDQAATDEPEPETSKAPHLNCPTCQKSIAWSNDFPFRPFCSKRCQQIDFGDWAAEQHSIPGDELATHLDDDSQPFSH